MKERKFKVSGLDVHIQAPNQERLDEAIKRETKRVKLHAIKLKEVR